MANFNQNDICKNSTASTAFTQSIAYICTIAMFLCALAICLMLSSTNSWAQGLIFPQNNNGSAAKVQVPLRVDNTASNQPQVNSNANSAILSAYGNNNFYGTSVQPSASASASPSEQQPIQTPLRPQTTSVPSPATQINLQNNASGQLSFGSSNAGATSNFGTNDFTNNVGSAGQVNFGTTSSTTNAGAASNFGGSNFTNLVNTNVNTASNGFNNQLFAQQTGGSINPYSAVAANDYTVQKQRAAIQAASNNRAGLPRRSTNYNPPSSGGGGLLGNITGALNIGGGIVSAAANVGNLAGGLSNALGSLGEGTGALSNFANSGIGQGIQNGAQFVSTNASNFSNFAANPLAGVSGTGFGNTLGITEGDITLAQQTLGTTSQVAGAAAAIGAFTGDDNAGNFAAIAAGTGALSGGQTLNFSNTQGGNIVSGAANSVSNSTSGIQNTVGSAVGSVQGAIDDSNIVEAAGHLGVNNPSANIDVSIAGTSPSNTLGGISGLANSIQQSFTPPENSGIAATDGAS